MTPGNLKRHIIDHVRIPARWIFLLMAIAILSFMAITADLGDTNAATPNQPNLENDGLLKFDQELFTEANGSADPFAPSFAEGDMIEETIVSFGQHPIDAGASSSSLLGLPYLPA